MNVDYGKSQIKKYSHCITLATGLLASATLAGYVKGQTTGLAASALTP